MTQCRLTDLSVVTANIYSPHHDLIAADLLRRETNFQLQASSVVRKGPSGVVVEDEWGVVKAVVMVEAGRVLLLDEGKAEGKRRRRTRRWGEESASDKARNAKTVL